MSKAKDLLSTISEAKVKSVKFKPSMFKNYDRNMRTLEVDKPMLAKVSIKDLLDMAEFEIKKLWKDLPTDVAYNLSDFFTDKQLQALYDKADEQGYSTFFKRDILQALTGA